LLDTGATINILPHFVGLQLGLVWENYTRIVPLSGNLSATTGKIVAVTAQVAAFAPVILVFAWLSTDNARLLLGQTNFLMEFDVCFFRSQQVFEIQPKI